MMPALPIVSVATGPVCGQDVRLWSDGASGAKGTDKNDTPTLKIFPPPKDAEGPLPAVLFEPAAAVLGQLSPSRGVPELEGFHIVKRRAGDIHTLQGRQDARE